MTERNPVPRNQAPRNQAPPNQAPPNQTPCCCGTLAQQQKRIARFNALIETLSSANSGDARRILHHAQQTKARIEKWIAAHSHAPARPMRLDAAWQAQVQAQVRTQVRTMTHAAGEGA